MNYRNVIALILITVAQTGLTASGNKQNLEVRVAADGKGNIQLIWFPPLGQWPAGGWRIEEGHNHHVIAAHIQPGETTLMPDLSSQDAAVVKKLGSMLALKQSPKKTKLFYSIMALKVYLNWPFAQAVGLARTLHNVPAGKHVYWLVGLDTHGKPTGLVLQSKPVDAAVMTPLPVTPVGGKAESNAQGVVITWQGTPVNLDIPVVSYQVMRGTGGLNYNAVNTAPVLAITIKLPAPIQLTDKKAPLETEVTYHIYSVDIFGRRSLPFQFKYFVPDLQALIAPTQVRATAADGEVHLHWQVNTNAFTAGYIIERAFLHDGPFVAINRQALAADKDSYTDQNVRSGTTYYYQLRSMGPRGDLGEPSPMVAVTPRSAQAFPTPQGVQAQVGRTRVQLSWAPLRQFVAGYLVQRRDGESTRWSQLNATVTPEPRYDDYFGLGREGTVSYRIIAIGYDNAQSEPSAVVTVALPQTTPPPAPRISALTSADAKVTVQFTPVSPESRSHQFLLLRSDKRDESGIVIGAPLDADARRFEDTSVQAGNEYWYRVIAIDSAGNRSAPSEARVIDVVNAPIRQGEAPEPKLMTSPFRRVVMTLAAPPEGLLAVVQVKKGETAPWLVFAGPTDQRAELTDMDLPPRGQVQYRVVYQAPNGAQGKPSAPVAVDVSP
jgi:chitodextrinase